MRIIRVIVAAAVFVAVADAGAGKQPVDPVGSWDGTLVYKLKVSKLGKVRTETQDFGSFSADIQPGYQFYTWHLGHGGGDWSSRGRSGTRLRLNWDSVDQYMFGRSINGIARANGHPELGEPDEEMRVELVKGKGGGRIKGGEILVLRSNVRFTVTSDLHPGQTWKGKIRMKHSMDRR